MIVLESNFHRCDGRCYNATTPIHTCKCVCGGKNHGVGASTAWNNYNRQKMFPFLSKIEKRKRTKGGQRGAAKRGE